MENKRCVLIVDDEIPNIVALSHILKPDYEICAVRNGQEAIDAAEHFLPDVILLDIIMPEMDGYDVIRVLKQLAPTKDIPVIFITGLCDAEAEAKGLILGAADYIAKPFSPAVVQLRVRNQMQIIEMRRELEVARGEKPSV